MCLVVLALLVGPGLGIPQAAPASAASNGLWSVFPTTRPGQPPGEFFHPVLMPGKVSADTLTVANYTTAPITFHLYGADAFNTRDGGLSVRRRTDPKLDIGKWITLPYSELTVRARSAAVVPFSIRPPPQATPGDHVGGIVAEQTKGTTSKAGSVPITVVQAVGVRVYGRVVGPLHPKLTLGQTSLALKSSSATQFGGSVTADVHFTVTNAGNSVLSPAAAVQLSTPFGTVARRPLTMSQLLPGTSLAYALSFPGVSAYGHLRATVTVTAPHATATATATAWAIPWGLLVTVAAAVLAVALLVRRHRRGRPRAAATMEPNSPPEPAGSGGATEGPVALETGEIGGSAIRHVEPSD